MRSPRGLSASQFIKLLKIYGYEIASQKGSHIKVTTNKGGEHHLAIPNHDPLKIGTLNAISRQVAEHFGKSKQDVFNELFKQITVNVDQVVKPYIAIPHFRCCLPLQIHLHHLPPCTRAVSVVFPYI